MIVSGQIDELPITTSGEIEALMEDYPNLGYGGWRIPKHAEVEFLEQRKKLRAASIAMNLCRRVFRDPLFRKKFHGKYTDYKLKHVVEFWEFDPAPCYPPPVLRHYNGIYVCQGVAVAAALLEGFDVRQFSPTSFGSMITVPRSRPAPKRAHTDSG